jgi:hypothetical protein
VGVGGDPARVLVDNGSTALTAAVAEATVVFEAVPGFGSAC